MSQLNVLQAGRAIAALAVVLCHAPGFTEGNAGRLPDWLDATLTRGFLGVDFFFVLSGFLIYYTARDISPSRQAAAYFAWRRFARVFLPYWPIGLSLAASISLLPGLAGSAPQDWTWLETLTLAPSNGNPSLIVAWTLQHELTFYLIFAIGILIRRPVILVAAWMLAVVASLLAGWEMVRPLASTLAPINLEFGLGVFTAMYYLSGRKLEWWGLLSGIAVPVGLWITFGATRSLSPIAGIAVPFLILAFAQAEKSGSVKVARWLVILGNASYAIYLIHYPLSGLMAKIVGQLAPGAWAISPVACVGASIVGGLIYHFLYEKPLMAWAQGKSQKTAMAAPPFRSGSQLFQ